VSDILFKNMLTRARQLLGMGQPGEVKALIRWFEEHHSVDNGDGGGYFNTDMNDDRECNRIFFMSGEMRASFISYGQFFNLDATCKTNRFGMQLVLMVGSNQIFGNAVFGVALIATESYSAYTWILQQVKLAIGQYACTHLHSLPHALLHTFYCTF
jgi:hypothetical protein